MNGHTRLRTLLAAMPAILVLVCPGVAPAAEVPDELRQLPASAAPPPEITQLENQIGTAKPAATRASKVELAQRIAAQPGGVLQLDNARARRLDKTLASSASLPAEFAATDAAMRLAPTPPRTLRPAKQELEAVIQRQPGGSAKLQRARQPLNPALQKPRISMLDLFGIGSARAAGNLSITLTPQTNASGNHAALASTSPIASAMIVGSVVSPSYPSNAYAFLYSVSYDWGGGLTSSITRPFVGLVFNAPEAGYYIINTRASAGAGVQLRHRGTTLQTYQDTGLTDRPALVNLSPGYHYFQWIFPGNAFFYSASIDSFP